MADGKDTASRTTGEVIAESVKVALRETIAACRVLVDASVTQQDYAARGDRPARSVFKQSAILVGGDRILAYEIVGNDKSDALPAGCYILSNRCFRLGQYSRVEIDAGRPSSLIFSRLMTPQELAMFATTGGAVSDFI